MKQLKKLVFVMAFVMMVTLCAGAMAEENDTVTITVKAIDDFTKEPIVKTLMCAHSQCTSKSHTTVPCACFDPNSAAWGYSGLSPCECEEKWQEHSEALTGSTVTFTLKKGHKYLVYATFNPFGYGEEYLKQCPGAYVYADPVTGELSYLPNGVNIEKTGEAEFTISFVSHFEPVDVSINATKLMDGADPGEQQFGFRLWKLTDEQLYEVFDPYKIFAEEDFAHIDFSTLPEDVSPFDLLTPESLEKICDRVQTRLKKYPYTIIYNDGKNVPVHNKTYTIYDMWDTHQTTFNYVISENPEPGKPICYDKAIYAVSASLEAWYPTLPCGLEDDYIPSTPMYGETMEPIQYFIKGIIGISPELGFTMLRGDNAQEVDFSELFVFRNRTCPFYNPPAAPETPAAPAVPQTGDNSPILVWLALLCISGMALLTLNRKKA